jgi:diaminopropionate ammonia-lyase
MISGESGASTTGFVIDLMRRPDLAAMRSELEIGPDSSVLCISTEGDTDRENYRAVVWNGRCPYPEK